MTNFLNNEVLCNSNSVILNYRLVFNTHISKILKTSVEYKYSENDPWKILTKNINWYYQPLEENIIIPQSNTDKVYLRNLISDGWIEDLKINTSIVEINNSTQDEHDYEWYKNQPLTFEILEDGVITWNFYWDSNDNAGYKGRPIYYNINNSDYIKVYPNYIYGNKNGIVLGNNNGGNSIQVHTGDIVHIKSGHLVLNIIHTDENNEIHGFTSVNAGEDGCGGFIEDSSTGYVDENDIFHYWNDDHTSNEQYYYFSTTCKFNLSGNLLSMFVGDDFINYDETIDYEILKYNYSNYPYASRETKYSLVGFPLLPCGGIFKNNVNLIKANNLILPNIGHTSFKNLFKNCINLILPPIIPNIIIDKVSGINGIQERTLLENLVDNMYNNCNKLNKVICLLNNNINLLSFNNWLNNTNEEGILYKDPSVDASLFRDIIPEGWIIQDYEGDI